MDEATISQYTLKEIEEGLGKTFKVNITESMVNEFAKISGDYSPMHMDEEHARKTEFKSRICHGMLVGSFFSRLVGMYLPGENGLLLSYSCRHLAACYLDQDVEVGGIIVSKSESTRIITIKATVRDAMGKLLVDGQLKVLVLK
jgi:3-hydroxybutyryl-CoA dehydratase